MRVQTQILIFILCINVSFTLLMNLNASGTPIGGMNYVQPLNASSSFNDTINQYNATAVASAWSQNTYSIPVIGDIFSGFSFLIKNMAYLLGGFAFMLSWIGDGMIVDSGARAAWVVITGALSAMFAVLMFLWMIELISGRVLND